MRPASPRSRARRVLEDRSHHPGRLVDVGIGPHRPGGIRADLPVEARQRIGDEVAAFLVHEREIAGEGGRDRRLAERHRLGDRQPEALAAVKRDVAVAEGGQRRQPFAFEVPVRDDDVAPAGCCLPYTPQIAWQLIAVDGLEVEERAAGLGEGARERVDQAERVLPLQRAEEVEREQEDERVVGQAQLGTRQSRRLEDDDG